MRALQLVRTAPVLAAARLQTLQADRDAGMTTAEYAVGTVAACGFAGVLWAVVHSDAVARLMQGVVERALTLGT